MTENEKRYHSCDSVWFWRGEATTSEMVRVGQQLRYRTFDRQGALLQGGLAKSWKEGRDRVFGFIGVGLDII
jgi:hypothetical protein